jgi:hypothetical protein
MNKPLDESEWFACEACDMPRTNEELAKGAEPYGESYFCFNRCDSVGDLDRCHRCEDVYKSEDLTNGGEYDPSNNYCHDCLISEAEDRRESRLANSDYRHATN